MNLKTNNKKICLVVSSLGKGGAEKSSALLSEMLDSLGFEVYIVSVQNNIAYDFKGELLNLDLFVTNRNSLLKKIAKAKYFKIFLKQHQFEYIIDNRSRNYWLREFIITNFCYSTYKIIYVVRSFNLNYYFSKNKFLAKLNYRGASAIVGVSKAIKEEVERLYGFKNVYAISNPVKINNTKTEMTDHLGKYILAYGRLDEKVKNYTLLFEAYKESKLSENNVGLIILGSGPDLDLLKRKVNELNISEYVEFKPFDDKPYDIIKQARFVCLTSRFEGFPRVLIESLSLGIPVISVDCKSGPNEIIQSGYNGLLVENNNPKELSEAMNSFIFDKALYDHCKSNTIKSVEKYDSDTIAKEWQKLLNSIE